MTDALSDGTYKYDTVAGELTTTPSSALTGTGVVKASNTAISKWTVTSDNGDLAKDAYSEWYVTLSSGKVTAYTAKK